MKVDVVSDGAAPPPSSHPSVPLFLPFWVAVRGDQHPSVPRQGPADWEAFLGLSQPCCSLGLGCWLWPAQPDTGPKRTCGTSRWMQGTFLG